MLVRMAIYSGTGIRGRANGSVLPLLGSQRSFMKATRFGMKLPLDSFEIRLKDEGPGTCAYAGTYQGEFYFHEYPQKEKGFFAAVCSEDPEIDDMLRWMTL